MRVKKTDAVMESLRRKGEPKSEVTLSGFLLSLVLIIPVTIWSGFVFSQLWEWFIVGTFDIVKLSVLQGAGVVFTYRWLSMRLDRENSPKLTVGWILFSVFKNLMAGGLTLLFGWILFSVI